MSELLGVLQQIMQENQKAMKPTDIAFGIVMSTSPLAIQTDTMQNPIPEKPWCLQMLWLREMHQCRAGKAA